ncbi:MAG: hypothetical protein Hens2KO_21490 [Henriciella sp.]
MTIKTKTLDVAIGSRVAAVRIACGDLAEDIARQLGLSEADYIARESGEERFLARDLSRLAGLFSVEVRCFFEEAQLSTGSAERPIGFSLSDWIEDSRRSEGLSALLDLQAHAELDPPAVKAA